MKIAKVIANPYCAVDKDGIPQGVVGLPGARGIWIGARLDPVASEKAETHRFHFPPDKDGKPRVYEVPVEDAGVRGFIATAVNEGSLLAADEETARLFGIPVNEKEPSRGYLPVEKILEAERAKALEHFRAHRGEKATLREVPTEPTPVDPEAVPRQDGKTIRLDAVVSLIKPERE